MANATSITVSTEKTAIKENSYLAAFNQLLKFMHETNWGNTFDKELSWRVQLLKSDWVLQPAKYDKYYHTWPESRKYTLSNPFLHKKMKIAMWLLDHHITLPLRVASRILKK